MKNFFPLFFTFTISSGNKEDIKNQSVLLVERDTVFLVFMRGGSRC
jgi:hypothetical protein